jgi:hypothetical protein
MVGATSLWVEVHGSRWLTFAQGGFIAACAMALYLSSSAVAGPFAGVAAALAGVAWLAWRARCQARYCLCELWLDEEGSVQWYDRMGRFGRGQVVAAVRAGGGWVSLSAQADRQTMQTWAQRGTRAGKRAARAGWRPKPGCGTGRHAWLLPADALDPEAFRALAVRVPYTPRGRP